VGGSGLFSARDEAALVLCVPVVVLNGTAATIQSSPRPPPGWEAGAGGGTRRETDVSDQIKTTITRGRIAGIVLTEETAERILRYCRTQALIGTPITPGEVIDHLATLERREQ